MCIRDRDNILDVEGWYGENPDLVDLLLHYLNGHRQTIYQEQEIFAYAAVEDEETGAVSYTHLDVYKRQKKRAVKLYSTVLE